MTTNAVPLTSTQGTFVCKKCKEVVHYDFNEIIAEKDWNRLRDLGLPKDRANTSMQSFNAHSNSSPMTTAVDPERFLDQSFVFIQNTMEKAQNSIILRSNNHSSSLSSATLTLNNNNNNNNNNNSGKNKNKSKHKNKHKHKHNLAEHTNANANANANATDNVIALNTTSALLDGQPTQPTQPPPQPSSASPSSATATAAMAGPGAGSDDATNAASSHPHPHPHHTDGSPSSSSSSSGSAIVSSAKNDFAHSIHILESILQMSAGHAQVQHPLCEDCTQKVMARLDHALEDLRCEQQTYTDFIHQYSNEEQVSINPKLVNTRQRSHQNTSIDAHHKLQRYSTEILALEQRLRTMQMSKKRLSLELEQLEAESIRMNKFEELFFCDANDFWYSIENLSMQHSAVRQKIREVSTHLETMKQTNVFDDAFHIFHDGHFGTINGLRLGRLPSVNIEWEEINTGLGQCVLLLDVLAQRCKSKHFKLNGYQLYPMGSASYIKERIASGKQSGKQSGKHSGKQSVTHHMYGSSQGFWGHKKCDKALECFLQCMKQFADWMHAQDSNFRLRYEIRGDLIGDARTNKFVKIGFSLNTEENWTQALKYMVIDLKYLLAWVARFSP